MATEIRLCVKYPVFGGQEYVVYSKWMLDSSGSRAWLDEMMSHAQELSTLAVWWVEKRENPEDSTL